MGNALFGDRDTLGPARRIEGLLANAMGGGFLAEFRGWQGSGSESLTQPGASFVDDGAATGAIVRGVPLRVEELGGSPRVLAVPDEASDGGAGAS
jgi:hypothetical protein